MATTRRPPNGVAGPPGKCFQRSEIFAAFQLIEADVSFDGNTGPGIAEIGIIAGYDGKAFSFGFPGEVCNGV